MQMRFYNFLDSPRVPLFGFFKKKHVLFKNENFYLFMNDIPETTNNSVDNKCCAQNG